MSQSTSEITMRETMMKYINSVKAACLFASLSSGVVAGANASDFDVERKYARTCAACHVSGMAGAPIAFNQQSWAPAMDKGMETLVANAINGINAMPPGGLCMDCTPEQFEALIRYMAAPKAK